MSERVMLNRFGFTRFISVVAGGTLGLLIGLCAWGLGSASAQESKTIVFDAPGADVTAGDFNGTYAGAINARGVITGAYQDAGGTYHGFLRSPSGEFATFDAPGADLTPGDYNGTFPSAMNDLGVITGVYWDVNGFSHGFLRDQEGRFTSFDVSGVGGYGSTPKAIDIEGAVVGYDLDSNYVFYAFVRNPDGSFKTFAGPGACTTGTPNGCYGNEATAIGIRGTIAGNYMDSNFVSHGMLRHPDGTITKFDVPGAGTLPGSYQGTGCPGCSSGFNLRGEIAATYTDGNNVHHGFVRSARGGFTTFDAPGAGSGAYQGTGCFSDCPVSLNNAGAITGQYIDANLVQHGYLRSAEGRITSIDPQGSFYTFSSGINDSGAITGYYRDVNNVYHGFLRIPD